MRTIHDIPKMKSVRRKLRRVATPQEILLWAQLRNNRFGLKFRRQHSLGKYVADFYCASVNLVIELDGFQHGDEEEKKYDEERTAFFEGLGFRVLRFWNGEVNTNMSGVITEIEKYCDRKK